MALTTHLRLVPKLRMSGAIPLLPQYAVIAWTGTALTFTTRQSLTQQSETRLQ